MSFESFLTIVAILLAPLVALRVSKMLDDNKEVKRRKLEILRVLMETRGAGMITAHVRALNRIDIEFYKEEKVVAKWREYQDHLSSHNSVDNENEELVGRWVSKKDEMLTELLYEMSRNLGYNFDRVYIKRGHYFPQGYVDAGKDKMIVRKGWVDVFTNKRPFPVLMYDQSKLKKQKEKPETEKNE